MLQREKQQTYIRWLRQNVSNSSVSHEFHERAWETARKAAQLLKEQYGAHRVRVFGSLVHEGTFHPDSDIDLAVEGLKPSDYWAALTSVMFLDDQVSVEMVDRATCRSEIWAAVEREGIEV